MTDAFRPEPTTRGRTLRVDPHVHTVASYDSSQEPAVLLSRAEQVGLDGVVVTDHDTVRGAKVVADLAAGYDLVAIVGCEVSTAGGHLLAIGVDAAPEPGRPLATTAREVREMGGVAVVPHPFQRSRHGANAATIADVDGIEVYNALTVTNLRNQQARRFADRKGYPTFGSSDAHAARNVGIAATEVRLAPGEEPSEDTVLAAMRAGRTAAVGRRTSSLQYLSRMVATARRKTPSLR